jgi:hypothetical protein
MKGDFFEGVEQVEAFLLGEKVKLPVFYRSARSFTAVFPASLFSLRRMVPDRRFVPAQLLPGVGGIHLTAFEYYDTDIHPYNEFAVGVLLNAPRFLQVPGYNALRQLVQGEFYTYIHRLPVNTEISLRGGVDIYNFPKFMAEITFTDTAEEVTCELREGGDLICRLSGRKVEARRSGVMKYFCHLYQSKQPQMAEFKINARAYTILPGPGNARLELGTSHPVAAELSRALLAPVPLIYIYNPDMQGILYGPDHLFMPLIYRMIRDNLGVDLESLRRTGLPSPQPEPSA